MSPRVSRIWQRRWDARGGIRSGSSVTKEFTSRGLDPRVHVFVPQKKEIRRGWPGQARPRGSLGSDSIWSDLAIAPTPTSPAGGGGSASSGIARELAQAARLVAKARAARLVLFTAYFPVCRAAEPRRASAGHRMRGFDAWSPYPRAGCSGSFPAQAAMGLLFVYSRATIVVCCFGTLAKLRFQLSISESLIWNI